MSNEAFTGSFSSLDAHNGCLGLFRGQLDYSSAVPKAVKSAGKPKWAASYGRTSTFRQAALQQENSASIVAIRRCEPTLESSADSFAELARVHVDFDSPGSKSHRRWQKVSTTANYIPVAEVVQLFPRVDDAFVASLWAAHGGARSTLSVLAAVVDAHGRLLPGIGPMPTGLTISIAVDWPALGKPRAAVDAFSGAGAPSPIGSDWDVLSAGENDSGGWEVVPHDAGAADAAADVTATTHAPISYLRVVLSFIPPPEAQAAARLQAARLGKPAWRGASSSAAHSGSCTGGRGGGSGRRGARAGAGAGGRHVPAVIVIDCIANGGDWSDGGGSGGGGDANSGNSDSGRGGGAAVVYDAVEAHAEHKYSGVRLRQFAVHKMRPQQVAIREKRIAAKEAARAR